MQEALLISLSLSITIDAINKLINPNHIEDASVMIFLGSLGVFIGLLGIFLFRGYDHDHNIGHEIVEQKKNDFVRSVCTTLRSLNMNNENVEDPLIPQTSVSAARSVHIPDLIVTESTTNTNNNNENNDKNNNIDESRTQSLEQILILPSLNDAYQNALTASDKPHEIGEHISERQLRVAELESLELKRTRNKSGDSIMSSTFTLNQDTFALDDEFQKSRVYATLHALCLHSLVNMHSA